MLARPMLFREPTPWEKQEITQNPSDVLLNAMWHHEACAGRLGPASHGVPNSFTCCIGMTCVLSVVIPGSFLIEGILEILTIGHSPDPYQPCVPRELVNLFKPLPAC